jgi:hypothetical protein
VIAGMIGAVITPARMPASRSLAIASMRFSGWEARGSSLRASSPSRVVTDSATDTARFSASRRRMSMSRSTRAFLVMTPTGQRASASTSRQPRVISSFFSIGW